MLRYQDFSLGINKIPDISGGLDISGNVLVGGDIIPATNVMYDLGSSTNRWRDIYLSGNTIDLGGTLIRKNEVGGISITDASDNLQDGAFNNVTVSGELDVSGNVTFNGTTTTVNSNILINDGTEVEPIIAFTNDINTGFYRAGSDTIGLTTGGVERLRVDASGNTSFTGNVTVTGNTSFTGNVTTNGNIGIGSSEPVTQLDVSGNSYFRGNIGIGSSEPQAALDISGNAFIGGHFIPSTTLQYDLGSATNRWKDIYLSGNTIDLGGMKITHDPSFHGIKIMDSSGNMSGGQFNSVVVTENIGIGKVPTSQLDVSGNTSFTGNVGIGTTNPDYKLHVIGDTRIQGNLIVNGTQTIVDTNVNTTEILDITNDGTGPALRVTQTGVQPIAQFCDDTSTNVVFGIADGGNVSIGHNNPVTRLDVSGNSYFRGNVGIGKTATAQLDVSGTITGTQLVSTVASGTAPLTVSSTTAVTNLNADLLDGQDGSYYRNYNNLTNVPDMVNTFNGRTGNVTLTDTDVSTALTYVPLNPAASTSISGNLTFTGTTRDAINMGNNSIIGVNTLKINDPGTNEGILWDGGNLWKIYESPDNLGNGSGNLQIVKDSTRMATFNISGQFDIPVASGTAPLTVTSTTAVTNLNADLLDGLQGSQFMRSDGNTSTIGTITGTRLISTVASGTAPLTVTSTTAITNLNADLLDGQNGSYYLDWNNFTNKPNVVTSGSSPTFQQISFTGPSGDPAPVITSRTIPAGQGNANERTELILFHANDGTNSAGEDCITLRAPAIRLQTYNDATIADINNNGGSNDYLYINPNGQIYLGKNLSGAFVRLNDDIWFSDPQNGTIEIKNGSNTNWGTMVGYFNPPCSQKYKKNINIMDKDGLFEKYNDVKQTPVCSFHYNEDNDGDKKKLGIILENSPSYLSLDGTSLYTVGYIAMLHSAIQVLQDKVEKLESILQLNL